MTVGAALSVIGGEELVSMATLSDQLGFLVKEGNILGV